MLIWSKYLKDQLRESSLYSSKIIPSLTTNSISLQAELLQKLMLKLNSLSSPSVSKMFLKDEVQTLQSVATFLIKQPQYFISFCNRSKKEIFFISLLDSFFIVLHSASFFFYSFPSTFIVYLQLKYSFANDDMKR